MTGAGFLPSNELLEGSPAVFLKTGIGRAIRTLVGMFTIEVFESSTQYKEEAKGFVIWRFNHDSLDWSLTKCDVYYLFKIKEYYVS